MTTTLPLVGRLAEIYVCGVVLVVVVAGCRHTAPKPPPLAQPTVPRWRCLALGGWVELVGSCPDGLWRQWRSEVGVETSE